MPNYFIHIPRTGGNAIGRVLPTTFYKYIGHDLRSKDYIHASKICSENDIVFTFVRNPYDRVISAFHFLFNGGMSDADAHDAYHMGIRTMTFKDFVFKKLEYAAQWQIHFLPQCFYLKDIINPNIYKYENIVADFAKLCKLLGADNIYLQSKNVNQSDRNRKIKDYYDKKTIKKVQSVYSCDFMNFGYSKKVPI